MDCTFVRVSEDKRHETIIGWGECKVSESGSLGFEIEEPFNGVLTKGGAVVWWGVDMEIQGSFSHT